MAAKYTEVKKVVKDKVTGEKTEVVTKYRVDADFKPAKASEIVLEYIANWCEANNQLPWLKAKITTPVIDKNGKEGKIQFVTLRNQFVTEFMPEIKKTKNTTKKETFHDTLAQRFGW